MPNEALTPLWFSETPSVHRPPLQGDAEFDVVVVGAGISGLTGALLLARAGKRVAVVDLHRVADGETGHTTAHLTELFDVGYTQLRERFGEEGARLAAQSARVAIGRIEQFTHEEKIDCGFRRLPVYLYTEHGDETKSLQKETDAARAAGVAAIFAPQAPVPFENFGALTVPDQADFDARRYVLGLAEGFERLGGKIFEMTKVDDIRDGTPCCVITARGTLTAASVLVTANAPISSRFFLQTKVAAYRTYAMSFPVSELPAPAALYWDTEDPYHYIRSFEGKRGLHVIVGGEDHKTGQGNPESSFEKLSRYALEKWGLRGPDARWSGQVLEPVDGLAFIGRDSASRHVYVATGFSGTGMTFGTLAGMILSDAVLERPNVYAKLYEATRIKPVAGAKDFVTENVDYPLHMLKDRLRPATAHALSEVPVGEGRIVELHGKKVAVCQMSAGKFSAVSPVCTHMGCHVRWNNGEKSWDCPCHGARFDAQGRVLNGPARADLTPEKLE